MCFSSVHPDDEPAFDISWQKRIEVNLLNSTTASNDPMQYREFRYLERQCPDRRSQPRIPPPILVLASQGNFLQQCLVAL